MKTPEKDILKGFDNWEEAAKYYYEHHEECRKTFELMNSEFTKIALDYEEEKTQNSRLAQKCSDYADKITELQGLLREVKTHVIPSYCELRERIEKAIQQ
jgi:hypothetical protein